LGVGGMHPEDFVTIVEQLGSPPLEVEEAGRGTLSYVRCVGSSAPKYCSRWHIWSWVVCGPSRLLFLPPLIGMGKYIGHSDFKQAMSAFCHLALPFLQGR